jgi:hypothetical protein
MLTIILSQSGLLLCKHSQRILTLNSVVPSSSKMSDDSGFIPDFPKELRELFQRRHWSVASPPFAQAVGRSLARQHPLMHLHAGDVVGMRNLFELFDRNFFCVARED